MHETDHFVVNFSNLDKCAEAWYHIECVRSYENLSLWIWIDCNLILFIQMASNLLVHSNLAAFTYIFVLCADGCLCIKCKLRSCDYFSLFAWAMYTSSRCCMHVNIFQMVHFSVFKTSNRYFHGSIRSQQDSNIQEEQKKTVHVKMSIWFLSVCFLSLSSIALSLSLSLLSCNRFDPVATRFSSSGCLFPFKFTLKLDLLFASNGTLRTEYRCKEHAYSS